MGQLDQCKRGNAASFVFDNYCVIRTGIDEAIRCHNKLLLTLSKSTVASGWVEREVKTALAKVREE